MWAEPAAAVLASPGLGWMTARRSGSTADAAAVAALSASGSDEPRHSSCTARRTLFSCF